MAYQTSTAASSVANPLQLMVEGVGGNAPSIWTYSSTHTTTDAKTAGFFSERQGL